MNAYQIDPKFPTFYAKYKNLTEKVMGLLLAVPDKMNLIWGRPRNKVQFNGESGISVSHFREPQFGTLLSRNFDEIKKFIEFRDAEDEFRKCWDGDRGYGIIPETFLVKVIDMTQGYVFNLDTFNRVYEEYETFLVTRTVKYRSKAFLDNFETDLDSFRFDEDIYIKKMNEVEFAKMLDRGSLLHPSFNMMRWRFCIETDYSVQEGDGTHKDILKHKEIRNLLTNFIFAMRLFKAGNLSCPDYDYYPLSWVFLVEGRSAFYEPTVIARGSGRNYVLKGQEGDELKAFWIKYKSLLPTLVNFLFLGIAINRFNSSFSNEKFEDKLIDLMISFEALYLTGNEQQELNYRLALRTAYNLSDEFGDKKQIFTDMKNAYKLRSLIVHGKKYSKVSEGILGTYKTIDDFIYKIEDYLRVSIRKFMDYVCRFASQEKVINYLDEKILEQ